MQHTVAGGRPANCIIDMNIDEAGTTRHDAVMAVAPAVRDAWQDAMVGTMPATVSFTGCHYIDLDSLGGLSGQLGFNAAKPKVGTGAPPVSPPSVSPLVHKVASATRGTRNGRMYLPGITEGLVGDDGNIVAAYVTTVNNALNALKNALNSSGSVFPPADCKWRVVHVVGHESTPSPGYPNGKPNAWNSTDVQSAFIDAKAATQRRRLRK